MTDKFIIEIDGRACEAAPGEMIIAVADRENIPIPRFCYHKKLSSAASCRMCLVEGEQGGRIFAKLLPACATPAEPSMKIWTRSARVIAAQQGTLEFLLINHPLDCPICDQGGECELQDISRAYGQDTSRFREPKRITQDENIGSLIATDLTRCILCTRCIRFYAEIAGVRELGAFGRGGTTQIRTNLAQFLTHELSGNVIDLCPVGALTSKPFRFQARAWELKETTGISPHDGVGSNLKLHVKGQKILRVHPAENGLVNETWIADRDRFSYTALTSEDRLQTPMIKQAGVWQATDWSTALNLIIENFKQTDPNQQAWLVAPHATLEEYYLAQRIARGLGCPNIEHRLRQQDFRSDPADPLLPWLGVRITELEQQKFILIIGSDLRQEHPLFAHRVRNAAKKGAQIVAINPLTLEWNHAIQQFVGTPHEMIVNLRSIAQVLEITQINAQEEVKSSYQTIAAKLREAGAAQQGLILFGALAFAHPDFTILKSIAYSIAEQTQCRIGYLPLGANNVGAYLAGAHPQRLPGARIAEQAGFTLDVLLQQPPKTLVLWGVEPDRDVINPAGASAAFAQCEFVVACSGFRSQALENLAQVLLPIGTFAETAGTFVNASGIWQTFAAAIPPPGEARPGWKVLRVLGNLLNLANFNYQTSDEIRDELAAQCKDLEWGNLPYAAFPNVPDSQATNNLMRIGTVPIYSIDPLVRRALPLQQVPIPHANWGVYLNPQQAAILKIINQEAVIIQQGEFRAEAKVILDTTIPLGCAVIPAGVSGSEQLGTQIGSITITKVKQ